MPIKKDGKLPRTPLDVERSCTDCCCILIFAAALAGLGACIYIAYEKGDITRLESLPDYQGTQCVGKFIFFPQDDGGLNLHKQVCVDACPTANEPVTTILKPFETARRLQGGLVSATQGAGIAETDSLLFGSNPSPQVLTTTVGVGGGMEPTPEPATPAAPAAPMFQETTVVTTMAPGQVRLQGYPSVPVANVLCFPKVGEFQGQVMGIAGSNEFFEIALDINSLTSWDA
ncbi:abhd17c [Symbiodinium sp. CCMP2592]|nr:abhd17c [Symbiodinium sp. CCMP2592]